MRRLFYVLLTLLFITGCSPKQSESDLATLKCDYFGSGFLYDAIYRVKEDEILSIVLTVISSTNASKEEVVTAVSALFSEEFEYSQKEDYKVLVALVDINDISPLTREHLLLNDLDSIEEFNVGNLKESIIKHAEGIDVEVVCSII